MVNKRVLKKFLVYTWLSCLIQISSAHAVSETDVIKSSMKHYPIIKTNLLKVDAATAEVQSSLGSFDTKIENDTKSFVNSYYDGWFTNFKASKNLGYLNSTVYGGYRKSSGELPVYNLEYETADQGEAFLGFKVSLLKDNFIDANRLSLNLNKEEVNAAKARYNQTMLNVQNASIKAYWKWMVTGYQALAVEEILKLAKIRDKSIKRRIKAGDLAKIYAAENRQYILKREADLLKIRNKFEQDSAYLSLFYRDNNGTPILMNKLELLPKIKLSPVAGLIRNEKFLAFVYSNNPELQELYTVKKQQEQVIRFSKNRFLPKLDVKYEWAQPSGSGQSNLIDEESFVGLNFSLPLEFRKERGKYEKEKIKLQSLDIRISFLKDKINNQIINNITNLKTAQKMYKITLEQTKLAKKLVKAEQTKFNQGASDLILLNLREENLAETKISNLRALKTLKDQYADFLSIKMELIK